jgi:aryl-alcohol dehydrogenase-like predicted oxidoreductase
MQSRRLGSLPLPVSVIGFGTWAIGGPVTLGGKSLGWGPQNREESIKAVRRAVELGITFFDTADIYGLGASEQILGEALYPYKKDIVLCTKFGNRMTPSQTIAKDFSASSLLTSVDSSLRRLRREHIDVLLLHSPPDDMDWSNFDRAPLEKLQEQGKIGCYGVSCHGYRGAENVLFHRFGNVIEAIYNVLDRRLEMKVLPEAIRMKIGVIARVPLASGFLTNKYAASVHFDAMDVRSALSADDVQWRRDATQKLSSLPALPGGLTCSALRFCLSHPAVSTVIPGMRSVGQVEENARAADLGPLPEAWLRQALARVPTVCPEWT